eukprot:c16404_g1_i1.p1 GENE.c16404_g1_i1~~c16404_g1_i1.p1  ORF type:complete len:217 (-),score=33.47 c16404_g1_i1:71-700(-)
MKTAWVLVTSTILLASGNHATYKEGDLVEVYGNKFGPRANPSETYEWSKMPFCQPEKQNYESRGLAEVLRGDRKAHTMFDMPFGVDMPLKKLCDVELNFQNWFKIQTAAQHEYMFEFYIDSIPVHGALGTKSTDTSPPKIFNKFEFEISFNHNQIIAAKVIQSVADAIDLLEFNPDDIQTLPIFTSVRWVPTNVSFSDRMKQYSAPSPS